MQNKQSLLCAIFLTLSLMSCRRSSESKPVSDREPIWMIDSYRENGGFTFTKDMMVEYVATCLEPDQVHTAADANNKLVFTSGSPCVDLIPLVGTFDQLSVTTSGTHLILMAKGREYHFKIKAVRSTLSKSDCSDQGHDDGSEDGNEDGNE